ncbi:MAG: hypothetical protein MUC54_05505 [Chloroflexi bacterium]|nr:hypothetical protein [Chloroflexota bacterium]
MERRDQLIGGAVLIAIGVAVLVGQYVEALEQFILLGLGIVLLVLFAVLRNPGTLIGGGILTGLGAGVVIAANTGGDIAGAAVLFGLGLGFGGVWLVGALLRLPETRFWPLIPGAIMVALGFVVLAGSEEIQLPEWLWPALLMGLGVVVILAALRGRGPGRGGPTG